MVQDFVLKAVPEDFVVEEIFSRQLLDKGDFSVFRLEKKNRNTEDVLREIAAALRIRRKNIGFAGTKDKKAATSQFISIFRADAARASSLKLRDAALEFQGCLDEPITLGSHDGNRFRITIRNLDAAPETAVSCIPNYFDEQRFGSCNAAIGESIVKRDFKKAAELLLSSRTLFNDEIESHLARQQNDFVGALRIIPKKNLMLFIHSFQSLIFNIMLSDYLKGKSVPCSTVKYSEGEFVFPAGDFYEEKKAPVIGFATHLEDYEFKEALQRIMGAKKISPRDFVFRELAEFSQEGSERELFARVSDFRMLECSDDELNQGKKKIAVGFSLPKSSYATIVVKKLFC